jgi:hypothetical protein
MTSGARRSITIASAADHHARIGDHELLIADQDVLDADHGVSIDDQYGVVAITTS